MRLFEHPDFEQAMLRAAEHHGLSEQFIEKDYYITEILRICVAELGEKVVFKGGTSLSKGWGLITRLPARQHSKRSTGSRHTAAEAAAMQRALAGFETVDGPVMSDRAVAGADPYAFGVRRRGDFFDNQAVLEVCQAAVGRLPVRQREVITGYFFEETAVPDIAERRGVSQSTIYNQKSQAEKQLHDDDLFFSALVGLERARDRARVESLAERYPGGLFPDGRRIVHIEAA